MSLREQALKKRASLKIRVLLKPRAPLKTCVLLKPRAPLRTCVLLKPRASLKIRAPRGITRYISKFSQEQHLIKLIYVAVAASWLYLRRPAMLGSR